MIKNIVFDMGKTLVTFDRERYLAGYPISEDDRHLLFVELFETVEWIALDHGSLTVDEATEIICARLPEHLRATADDILHTWQLKREPIEGMEAIVRELKEKGYNIYVLSNISPAYWDIKKYIPALQLIDNDFLSCDYQLLKPCAEIYSAFIEKYSLVPEECMLIDDLPINIFMAERQGWNGVVFHNNAELLRKQLATILNI